MGMERKAVTLRLPDDAPPGSFQAIFSTFNVLDKGRDVVKRSAFDGLDGVEVPLVWSHEWQTLPLGKGTIHVQPKQAVVDGRFHLQTQASRDAYETVKAMGDLQEYSYGYDIAPDGAMFKDGEDGGPIREITQFSRIYEISPVLVGMGEDTRTLAIKAAAELLREEGKQDDPPATIPLVVAAETKVGKTLSKATQTEISAALQDVTKGAERLHTLIGDLPDADPATDDGKRAADASPPAAPPAAVAAVTVADLRAAGGSLPEASERLVADLAAYLAWTADQPDADLRAAGAWITSVMRRAGEVRVGLDDRLKRATAAPDETLHELKARSLTLVRQLTPIVERSPGWHR